ncbi:MAG TPA: hypothetical protein VNL94_04740 [Candidatus Binatia bacterium]|nr:hypothetical protein [Candidatus Binatia bacterium]
MLLWTSAVTPGGAATRFRQPNRFNLEVDEQQVEEQAGDDDREDQRLSRSATPSGQERSSYRHEASEGHDRRGGLPAPTRELDDSAGRSLEEVRSIRDDIELRVRGLLAELDLETASVR